MSEDTTNPNPETTEKTEEKASRQMSFTVTDTGDIRADFGPGLDPIQFSPSALPEVIFPHALAEGIISRLRSATSKLTGDGRTPATLREAIDKGLQSLVAGQWKIERAPGSGGEVSIAAEAAHLFRKRRAEKKGEEYTSTLAEDAAAYNALDEAKQKALAEVPSYAAAYAEVKAQRQAAKAAKLAKKAEAAEEDSPF